MNSLTTPIALVDDHVLLRSGLADLIRNFDGYDILFEANNGKDLIRQLDPLRLPDMVIADVNMPEMDGYETTLWLKDHYPRIKVLALSMYDNENTIIRMIRCGARGYILKDIDTAELKKVLDAIRTRGFYYSELVTNTIAHAVINVDIPDLLMQKFVVLQDREIDFLRLACSELTYKEIAEKMHVSPRTVDGYRDALFEKLNIKTRVGLVLYSIKNGVITP
jgi:DNA-binding NarL/FixJ family response regulator